jgi:hypothetical protein
MDGSEGRKDIDVHLTRLLYKLYEYYFVVTIDTSLVQGYGYASESFVSKLGPRAQAAALYSDISILKLAEFSKVQYLYGDRRMTGPT